VTRPFQRRDDSVQSRWRSGTVARRTARERRNRRCRTASDRQRDRRSVAPEWPGGTGCSPPGADGRILGPERNEAPTYHADRAPGPDLTDHGHRLRGRGVVTQVQFLRRLRFERTPRPLLPCSTAGNDSYFSQAACNKRLQSSDTRCVTTLTTTFSEIVSLTPKEEICKSRSRSMNG
jgi:hypothetical protein